ncbi:hypothetical protein GCM10010211_82420 [Streptomyces albospinus]|uniref:Uncharacterized protein n=2 Tax=Streptomyces albospinus TaxID=285515 RepID=A0ABQ2VR52_9ACTN|nr:hypothetical protein GCM10010211_82420 [Streptomyces albospinus]
MDARRVALLTTGLAVAAGASFSFLQWDTANRLATVLSALVGLAALGVSVWAALPGRQAAVVRVSNTGEARAGSDASANTGVTGPAAGLQESVEVDGTGRAEASGGGDANTGIRLN